MKCLNQNVVLPIDTVNVFSENGDFLNKKVIEFSAVPGSDESECENDEEEKKDEEEIDMVLMSNDEWEAKSLFPRMKKKTYSSKENADNHNSTDLFIVYPDDTEVK